METRGAFDPRMWWPRVHHGANAPRSPDFPPGGGKEPLVVNSAGTTQLDANASVHAIDHAVCPSSALRAASPLGGPDPLVVDSVGTPRLGANASDVAFDFHRCERVRQRHPPPSAPSLKGLSTLAPGCRCEAAATWGSASNLPSTL